MTGLTKLHAASLLLLSAAALPLQAQTVGDPDCSQLLLVSGYTNNNVKIYNACDYTFVRDLDSDGVLAGPQAIALDPNGDLVVVSESNGRLVRYYRDTLTLDRVIAGDDPATAAVEPSPVNNPTGLVIAPDGRMFAGSYSDQVVTEVDAATGAAVRNIVTQADSGIRGPDTGMWLQGDRLIVPGFDSSSLVEADINQVGSSRELVSQGAGGLNAPRTVLRQADGTLLVTSWRNSRIMAFDGDTGAFIRVVSTIVPRPTGIAFESDDVLLVASDSVHAIYRVRISTGENLGRVIGNEDGGLLGPTFIMVLNKGDERLAENRALWLVGVGSAEGNRIDVEDMYYTRNGVFGPGFNPQDVSLERWGSMALDFSGCAAGRMTWTTADQLFASGGFDVTRLAQDPDGQRCLDEGFAAVTGQDWMTGVWYGGPERDGEGLFVNVLSGGQVVLAWYTYLP